MIQLITKTSIRFFNNVAVRARWDDETFSWWYSANDIIAAIVKSKNSRRYWNTFKKRNPELSSFCRQLKLTASDGKRYDSDCLNQKGINTLILLLPAKERKQIQDWINGMSDPVDNQSKLKAYELFESPILNNIEIGTIKGLQQIHAYLFEGLYDFADQIRTRNISKGGFMFANYLYFEEIFQQIENMPDSNIDEIIDKYIEMNIAHPFMEGNGRAMRIWLDLLLKKRLGLCVDWQLIDKKDYLNAMEKSPTHDEHIHKLIKNALTQKIDDRELFMKGIDYSYYYESIDD